MNRLMILLLLLALMYALYKYQEQSNTGEEPAKLQKKSGSPEKDVGSKMTGLSKQQLYRSGPNKNGTGSISQKQQPNMPKKQPDNNKQRSSKPDLIDNDSLDNVSVNNISQYSIGSLDDAKSIDGYKQDSMLKSVDSDGSASFFNDEQSKASDFFFQG